MLAGVLILPMISPYWINFDYGNSNFYLEYFLKAQSYVDALDQCRLKHDSILAMLTQASADHILQSVVSNNLYNISKFMSVSDLQA